MKIKIKRFNKDLPLPEYKTKGAAAFDLLARETVEIKPSTTGMFIKFIRASWNEVGNMKHKTRGGFGSTGKK